MLTNELPTTPEQIPPTMRHRIGQSFILAGRAIFTLQGRAARFTYRVTVKAPEAGSRYTRPAYFVSLLTGSDNESDYTYLGILNASTGAVTLTRGSRMTTDAPAVKAIQWALPILFAGRDLPAPGQVFHEGRCGRCGRTLTVPESIASGIGPDCAGKMAGLAGGLAPVDLGNEAELRAVRRELAADAVGVQ